MQADYRLSSFQQVVGSSTYIGSTPSLSLLCKLLLSICLASIHLWHLSAPFTAWHSSSHLIQESTIVPCNHMLHDLVTDEGEGAVHLQLHLHH